MEHFEFISGRPIALSVPQQKVLLALLLDGDGGTQGRVEVGGGQGGLNISAAEILAHHGLIELEEIDGDETPIPSGRGKNDPLWQSERRLATLAFPAVTHTAPDSPAGLGQEWSDVVTDLLDQLAVAALRRKIARDMFDAQQFSRPDADGNRRRPRRGGQVGQINRAQRWAAVLGAPAVTD
jgi:hypothetical protein